ncbi:MAG: DUF3489 domain-containing protein [Bryobacteraceae bacterium]|jgi:hypothetical protein
MNAFTIDSDNNIAIHDTAKAARETGADVFDTAENLAELIGPDNKRLVEIWNSLTGVTPVKKFASRAVGARRIFAEVQKLAAPAAEIPGANRAPQTRARKEPKAAKRTPKQAKAEPKAGSKKDILFGLISRKNGASLEELTSALDWQKHSVRGFIATLGKTVRIESFKTEQGVRTYRALSAGGKKGS